VTCPFQSREWFAYVSDHTLLLLRAADVFLVLEID
jgi:hypothetical protein